MMEYSSLLLFPLGSIFTLFVLSPWSSWPKRILRSPSLLPNRSTLYITDPRTKIIRDIQHLAESHETAATMADMIQKDGAGSWPPRANHQHETWPAPLRVYKEIFMEMSSVMAIEKASLDDACDIKRIAGNRAMFRKLLSERVDMAQVRAILEAAEGGQWDIIPRDTYNAFYNCIAMCRHAYRWAIIPVVKVAQLETIVELPLELVEPWAYLQRHFGCRSDSGNITSNMTLNFDSNEEYVHRINANLNKTIMDSEEAFSRIMREVENLGLPMYHDMIRATISFARNDKAACALHMARLTNQLRPMLGAYYDRLHDKTIARSAWLSHVQGFYAWGAGYTDEKTGEWVKFDGLSGNQVLLFQAIDAFCGLKAYLSEEDQHRNMPKRQRQLREAFERHSFRWKLGDSEDDAKIAREFEEILRRLRVFRSAHRTRGKVYLSQPAPERLPMTAGKSLLKADIENSLEFLDGFMLRRIMQTQ
ncbi:hypothetical protein B0I35DRAFT_237799 [Stachybotrys elegans]|uniref:Uncharacterized protein n=1 Tax=Stachybotrys elegans TaxID=80388 RepID=A0A8K0SW12_9HYPO|nr:hypothetical protein B0I35DRAFT_237799 [Stachybotrys elegans]